MQPLHRLLTVIRAVAEQLLHSADVTHNLVIISKVLVDQAEGVLRRVACRKPCEMHGTQSIFFSSVWSRQQRRTLAPESVAMDAQCPCRRRG